MGYARELESSVHMRLYTLKKRHFAIIFLLSLVVILISIMFGLLGPAVLSRTTIYGSHLIKPSKLATGPFIIYSKPVFLYQKELWISAVFYREKNRTGISIPFKMETVTTCLSRIDKKEEIKKTNQFSKKGTLICHTKKCDEVLIAHIAVLNCDSYTFNISLMGFDASDQARGNVKKTSPLPPIKVIEVEFIMQTYNSNFSYFELVSRFVAVVAVFILHAVFMCSMREFEMKNWTQEQCWTATLLPFLLFFYNPLHPVIFLMKSWLPQACDYIFQVNFVASLLLFWICIYHGIRDTKRKFCSFYLPKFILVGLIWLSLIIITAWGLYFNHTNPSYDWMSSQTQLSVSFGILIILCFVYTLCFLVLMIRTCSELRTVPYFGVRLRFLAIPAFLVVLGGLITFCYRLKPELPLSYRPISATSDDALSEEIVSTYLSDSQIPATMFRSSFELSFIFGLLYTYMLSIVIVYSPSKNALIEANFKDNPTLSMANDSDEDVLYGSDDMEMRTLRRR